MVRPRNQGSANFHLIKRPVDDGFGHVSQVDDGEGEVAFDAGEVCG